MAARARNTGSGDGFAPLVSLPSLPEYLPDSLRPLRERQVEPVSVTSAMWSSPQVTPRHLYVPVGRFKLESVLLSKLEPENAYITFKLNLNFELAPLHPGERNTSRWGAVQARP